MMKHQGVVRVTVSCALLGLLAATAPAANLTWNGGVSGDWQDGGSGWLDGASPANWNNATPDAAIFDGATTLSPTVNAGGITVGDMVFSNGNYSFSGGTLTLSSGNMQVGSSLTATFNQALTGSVGLTKSGPGTLTLVGTNKNYSGTTTINGGAIQIGGVTNGTMGASLSGNVTLDGGALHTLFSANSTLNYALNIGASGGEIRNLGTDSQRATLAASKVTGSGTLTLSFGSSDTRIPVNSQSGFSGKWVVDSGGSFNRYADIQLNVNLGSGTGDDFLTLQNNGKILHRGGTLGSATQGITLGGGTSRVSIAGGVTVNIAGKLSGSSTNPLDIELGTSTSTGILANTANSFLGDAQLTGAGFVLLGASGVLPDDGGTVNVTNGATLDLNSYNEVIGGLTGNGKVDNRVASSAATLGIGGNNSNTLFAGTTTNSASGSSLQLVKVGTGTLTLSGAGIGHGGGTIISNGAIEISAAGAGRLGATSGSAVTLNGGTLQGNFLVNATVGNTITVGSLGGTLRNIGNDTQRWQFAANQLQGTGTLTLAFGSQNTRFTMSAAQDNFAGKWVLDSGGNQNRIADIFASTILGGASGADALTLLNYGSLALRDGVTLGSSTQGIYLGTGQAKIIATGGSTAVLAGAISGPVTNTVRLDTENSSSLLILSNSGNSWLGETTVAGPGVVRLGAAGVLPDNGGNILLNSGATLDLNGYDEALGGLFGAGRVDNRAAGVPVVLTVGGNNNSPTFSGSLTNSGAGSSLSLVKVGTGIQTLSGTNILGGFVRVEAGTLALSSAANLADATSITVNAGATILVIGRSDGSLNVGAAQVLTGDGAVIGIVSNRGVVAPAGLLMQTGNYVQAASGALRFTITGSASHDALRTSGAATLDGTLDVTSASYTPVAGDAFPIFRSASRNGSFATTNLPALSSGLGWVVSYLSTGVVLAVTGAPPATGYDGWAGGITNGLTNYNESATGDGYPNLLKYATGSSPTNSDTLAKLSATQSGGTLSLTFNRNTNAVDVVLVVQAAESVVDGAAWTGIATNIGGIWLTPGVNETGVGTPVQVTVPDSVSGATNRFLRLDVTRP